MCAAPQVSVAFGSVGFYDDVFGAERRRDGFTLGFFFWSYVFMGTLILMNMLLAIACDTFEEVVNDVSVDDDPRSDDGARQTCPAAAAAAARSHMRRRLLTRRCCSGSNQRPHSRS